MTINDADSILIIDDTPKVCALVARALSELPYRVITADSVRSGKAALDEIHRFRLLVVDFGLPDGTGLEIVDAARRLRPRMPIIMMSGYGVGESSLDVEFIQKPFDPEELVGRVEALAR